MSASPDTAYGLSEDDRVQALESPLAFARRRFDGEFHIDAFGGDAQLMDLAGLVIAFGVRVQVEHAERLPRIGGALVVANRGLGLVEPAALGVAVRVAVGRRLRVMRRLGAKTAGSVGQDVIAVLGEPVVVPVVLVGAVSVVGGRLPLVLVVAEPMQHDDQGVFRARVMCRLGEVDV